MIRQAEVAGRFYEGDPDALRRDVERHLDRSAKKEPVLGCVCPHAGYMFSGDVAGAVLSSVEIPPTVVVMSFSHRGMGEPFAVWPSGEWLTPLGSVPIDEELSAKLINDPSPLASDTEAFRYEHSGEVQLPFLQVLRPDVKVVMISIYPATGVSVLRSIGQAMAVEFESTESTPLVLASTDMTHQKSAEFAEKQDRLAIDRMLALDEEGLLDVVRTRDITMCGVCAVTAMIACVKAMGATTAKLVRYENSGKATGDYRSVVGYAGLTFK